MFKDQPSADQVEGSPDPPVSVEHLLNDYNLTEEDCGQVISDICMHDICMSYCRKWNQMAHHLGMTPIMVNDINRNCITEEEKRIEFFSKWREMKGSDATYGSLIRALLAINFRADAEGVCKVLLRSSNSAALWL